MTHHSCRLINGCIGGTQLGLLSFLILFYFFLVTAPAAAEPFFYMAPGALPVGTGEPSTDAGTVWTQR